LVAYFKGNKTFARELCSRAAEFNKLGAQFAASKKLASKLTSNKSRAMLPAKLATSTTKDPKKRELFVVEGDSAGGTAKKARDSYFQEILPLRGKIINAYGPSGARAFENNEVIALLQAIGYSPKNKHPEKHLRVGKIFIMADADPDGHHIALLVLSILYRVLPPLFVDKMVYMVNTPLFMASHRDKQFIGNTRKEVLDQAGSKAKGVIVTRFKGLGEISPDSGVLQAIAFNPKTRDVTLVDALAKSERPQFVALAGESPQQRKRLLFDEIRTTTGE
jgi:DNA gyrase/topoisomerase IV subunit B